MTKCLPFVIRFEEMNDIVKLQTFKYFFIAEINMVLRKKILIKGQHYIILIIAVVTPKLTF